jgi:hypothetical protein
MIINARLKILMEKQLFGVLCYGTVLQPECIKWSWLGFVCVCVWWGGSMFNASSLHTWLGAE